jgi:SAM-dependent methyltransferase
MKPNRAGAPDGARSAGHMRIGRGRRAGLRFDADHGVVTEALVFLGQLDPEAIGPSIADATHYEPTPLADFAALLDAVPVDLASMTFVDLGCGMGRALLLAAQRPFRQVLGIEISPALCEIARDNLAAFDRDLLRCRDVRVVRGDAQSAGLPRGSLFVYLYNPFHGAVMQRVVERLATHATGRLVIAYHTPLERALFDDSGAFELVRELICGVVYRRLPSTQ